MKSIALSFLALLIIECQDDQKPSQTTTEEVETKNIEVKEDTTKQMNLLDKQTEVLSSIFGAADSTNSNPFTGTTSYLELIEKTNLPKEQKDELREMYKIYDLSLDPRKKDSLKIVFNNKLQKAITKSN